MVTLLIDTPADCYPCWLLPLLIATPAGCYHCWFIPLLIATPAVCLLTYVLPNYLVHLMLQNKMAMRKVKGWICCLGQDKEDEPCVAYARQDERYKLNAWTLNPLPLGQPCSAKNNFTSRLEELRREKAPEILRRSASHWTLLLHWMEFVRLELKRKQ